MMISLIITIYDRFLEGARFYIGASLVLWTQLIYPILPRDVLCWGMQQLLVVSLRKDCSQLQEDVTKKTEL